MRIGIIAVQHESNTFSRQLTTLESFREDLWLEGDAICDRFANSYHEVGGFLAGLDELRAVTALDIVPLLAARALPSGIITGQALAELTERVIDKVRAAGRFDGLLVAPHGAAVSQTNSDADGYWLTKLRQEVGPNVLIVGTLDLHANLSSGMVQACNALIGYRTNPHLDQRQRGCEAASLLVRAIRHEVRPTMAAVFPPLAINIQKQSTDQPPLKPLYELADGQLDSAEVLTNSLLLGFPYADVPEMGPSAIVVTDNDVELARRLAADLGERIWQNRDELQGDLIGIAEALDRCARLPSGPICLLDMGDNVGGGSAADGTALVAAIHHRRLGPSFACLFDPESVTRCESAGVGAQMELRVGGKTDDLHGDPLDLEIIVHSLHEGQFTEDQPRHGGIVEFDQGQTAIVETNTGLTLMLTSRRMVPFSLRQLTSCGVAPETFRILVAKGVNAPVAAYRDVCQHFIQVNTPGATCADLSQLYFAQRRRPMYPFESNFAWTARDSERAESGL